MAVQKRKYAFAFKQEANQAAQPVKIALHRVIRAAVDARQGLRGAHPAAAQVAVSRFPGDTQRIGQLQPLPQQSETGMKAPGSLRLNVECWEQCQEYGDWLRRRCDPGRDTELDDRLKGVYGRMHVQAFKLAALFAALDWFRTGGEVTTVTADHWQAGQVLAEGWRQSAHRLLE